MILNFSQSTGTVTTEAGAFVAKGWAGRGDGKNNPDAQSIRSFGPLPQGLYKVGPWEEEHPGLGVAAAHFCGHGQGREDVPPGASGHDQCDARAHVWPPLISTRFSQSMRNTTARATRFMRMAEPP